MNRSQRKHLLLNATVFSLSLACAGADVNEGAPIGNNSGTGGTGGGPNINFGGQKGTEPFALPCPGDVCEDFPEKPVIEGGAEGAVAKFAAPPGSGAGPCVVEPEEGSLFPSNWLRPRIRWTGGTGPTQIRITTARQKHPLVVYTMQSEWKMPAEIWKNLSGHNRNEPIQIEVRQESGVSKTSFTVAWVTAEGSMVYWAAKPSEVGKDPTDKSALLDSELRGFAVGDESTVSALRIPQVEQPSREQSMNPRPVRCIGCHVATPDGQYVAFTDHWPWNTAIAGVKPGITGKSLPELSGGGLSAVNRPWGGMMTFSARHWVKGDRTMVLGSSMQNPTQPWSTDNKAKAELVWYDLESTTPTDPKVTVDGAQFGKLLRIGDTRGAASPDWGNASDTIVYASTAGNLDGRLETGATDLYTVPYADRKGGMALPVPGASESGFEEYYPAFSPDDKFIAFNRLPSGQKMYANPNAELFVVSTLAQSASAVRLAANDPPACTGKKSPGINNHWARWSPVHQSVGEATVYWIIFSSNRADIPPVRSEYKNPAMPNGSTVSVSQLYLTAVVEDESGIRTFPAIYMWNQSTDTLNTTPAWEAFQLPPVE
ncbi:MAG: hypothetical protein SGI86_06810 [Deltaproteobacteria bacterium]|nr:hypothetical protein [Deltaproteobacteria bacterium]